MKERPILFSAPMVRALLAGTKTQTRRVVKPHKVFVEWNVKGPDDAYDATTDDAGQGFFLVAGDHGYAGPVPCPYGNPGERLYVKETFYAWGRWETRYSAKKGRDEWHFIDMTLEAGRQYRYAANMGDNGPRQRGSITPQWWKRPAIFMPRHASRITLEIVSVRVERLNDISEDDALSEGIIYYDIPNNGLDPRRARTWFRGLWESISGAGSWAANPWVWVVQFKVLP